MEYPIEFKKLLDYIPKGYIGHGNPNAKILFIGQEPAIDPEANELQYHLEISGNAEKWKNIVSNRMGYETIDISKEVFSPLHPYLNQKFQVASMGYPLKR